MLASSNRSWADAMKVISNAGDFVEFEPRIATGDADLALTVRASRDGFLGETQTWIERHAWFAFAQALTVLEEQRSGEATVQSMSPGELNLTVKAIDRLGHIGIEGMVGKHEFDREVELRFSVFSFEPAQIVAFAQAARQISVTLGSRRAT